MNKFIGNGNLVRDVELRTSQTGTAVGRFTLAISRIVKNQDGEYDTDFINCVVFGKQAETMAKYTHKGSKIAVEGRIQTGRYEKDGQTRYTTDILAERIEFLDSKPKETKEENKEDVFESFGQQVENDMELPF